MLCSLSLVIQIESIFTVICTVLKFYFIIRKLCIGSDLQIFQNPWYNTGYLLWLWYLVDRKYGWCNDYWFGEWYHQAVL